MGLLFQDRCRIIEDDQGRFFPQFKYGILGWWRFFSPDKTGPITECRDPAYAASFETEAEAADFIAKVKAVAAAYWAERDASSLRQMYGVNVVKKIPITD